jgi:hypothetical protein
MAISRKPCTQCKQPMELTVVPAVAGEDGAYRLALESVPAMMCPDKHKRLIYPEFAMAVMDTIANPATSGVYAAVQRGLLRKRSYCGKCGAELIETRPVSHEFRVSVPVEGGAPLTAVLAAPCLKCAQCGTEQLPREQDLADHIF